MRKTLVIIGILLTVTVLISGSALAAWVYVVRVESETDCTNSSWVLYAPDGYHATIGANGTKGHIILDLGTGTSMGGGQEFIVFANSSARENYTLFLISQPSGYTSTPWENCDDTKDEYFTAPSPPSHEHWRFFDINCTQGVITENDPLYGSEIDAIGFYGI